MCLTARAVQGRRELGDFCCKKLPRLLLVNPSTSYTLKKIEGTVLRFLYVYLGLKT
jgi:hypothetical protein